MSSKRKAAYIFTMFLIIFTLTACSHSVDIEHELRKNGYLATSDRFIGTVLRDENSMTFPDFSHVAKAYAKSDNTLLMWESTKRTSDDGTYYLISIYEDVRLNTVDNNTYEFLSGNMTAQLKLTDNTLEPIN